jgi:hypothetical protein
MKKDLFNKKNMKYLIFLLAIVFTMSLSAQDCGDESLVQKPGTWKPGMKGSEGGTTTDLAREKKVVAAIHNMVKSKYSPTGVQADYLGTYSATYSTIPANNYAYRIIPLNYYCEGNSVKIAHETSTYFSITANLFDAEIYDTLRSSEASSGTGYHYILDMPIEKDGYWYFKEIDAGLGFGMKGKSKAWLITYNGKLPFSYVTKKEFLESRKVILTNEMRMSASGFKDVLNRNEMEKGFKEKEYKNDPEKLKKYMRMDYENIKARYEKLLADNERNFKPAFNKIESQLKMDETELSRPAIVKMDPHDHLSYLFTDDADQAGHILIKPNPGYFNKKLPKSSPQFFWIYIRGNHKEPIAAKFMTDIMKAVDFTILKNMLGK